MRTRRLGHSDLTVSCVGLGTMGWGATTTTTDAVAMLKRFVTAGGNLIDTAAAYGDGAVESLLGRIMAQTVKRSDLVIATKSGFVRRGSERVVDTSAATLLTDLHDSLRRLGTDHVDLWQIHAWGEAPLEETLAAVDTAVTEGSALTAGVSNFVGWQVAEAATWQRARRQTPLAGAQAEYSLLARRAELELLPAVRQLDVGFLAWSALGRGVLTGKYAAGTPKGSRGDSPGLAWFVEQYLDPGSRRIVDAVLTAADGLDLTPAQVGLLWVRDAPAVTAALVGPRQLDQLEPLLAVDDAVLPDEIAAALDDVSGGPNLGRPKASQPER